MEAKQQVLVILIILTFLSCSDKKEKLFSKLKAEETGIDFNNLNVETEQVNILTYEYFYNGGGVALGDINNDGLLDIYFTANAGENRLYLNKGGFHFENITASSGTACGIGWKTGVCMADVNGDGWLDIYVSRSKSEQPDLRTNLLFINNKNLTFTERGNEFGLDDKSYSTQTSFFDYDRDGDLDAFVLNHSLLRISNSFDISKRNTIVRYPDVGNRFLRNDNGKFVDVSDSLGIYGPAANYGLGISISDLNNDGWPDIYTGCDYTGRDKVLFNQHGRLFADVTDSVLSHMSKFTMGTDIADFNGDGLMDIVTLDMLPEDNARQKLLIGTDKFNIFNQMVNSGLHYQYMRNMLQMNMGNGSFSEVGQLAGISNTDWSWAPLFADFDNDGNLDLFVTNGFKRDLTNSDFAKYHAFQMIEEAHRKGQSISFLNLINHFKENKIHNYIYKGDGKLTFKDMVTDWGLDEPSLTNGAAYGDLDNDGDLDIVMNNINQSAGVYRNNSERNKKGHFIQIVLKGASRNAQAIGSRVEVYAAGKKITRELFTTRGFQSGVDPKIHIGIGEIEKIDSVVVQWPTGERQYVPTIAVDVVTTIPFNPTSNSSSKADDEMYFIKKNDFINFKHQENAFIDFNIQPLLPRKYSTMGPAVTKGDVNNDGLEDLFIGGAKGQLSSLFLQTTNGQFKESIQPAFEIDKSSEDIDALFFDADGDHDNDLYVVSGGYEFTDDAQFLQDRLYINNGHGIFKKSKLPEMLISGSCVRSSDVDQDGDIDLFVGGRIVPGRYPETPESVLLLNNGNGYFTIGKITADLKNAGMVTDATWCDINNDHFDDLIVVGEWMNVEVFINERGVLKKRTDEFVDGQNTGWWNCIAKGDFDDDGDDDFIVGNFGLNNQLKASDSTPVALIYDDFDQNGSVDPIISYYIQNVNFPYPAGDELVDQVPMFKKRFLNNTAYSIAKIDNILTPSEIIAASKLSINQMQSVYFENDHSKLRRKSLPIEMQIAPIFAIESLDANHDGILDFVAMGNLSGTRSRTGKLTGNTGFLFVGTKTGDFEFVSPQQTGLRCVGDVRHVTKIDDKLFVVNNNAPVQCYELAKK